MAATKSANNPEDWHQHMDTWFKGQRAFFDQQIKNSTAMHGQWSEVFSQWQENIGPSQPNAGSYQKFFAQAGQQYLDMMQHFYQSSGQNKPVNEMTEEWLRSLQQFFLGMLQNNTQPFDFAETGKAMTEAMTRGGQAWAQAFQPGGPFAQANWGGNFTPQGWGFNPQAFAPQGWGAQGWGQGFGNQGFGGFNPQSFGQNFGQFGQNLGQNLGQNFGQNFGWNPQAWGAGAQGGQAQGGFQSFDPFGFYASIPGIGYTREKQDDWNQLYKLFTEFVAQVRKYNAAMAQVGLEAIHNFQEYVANPPAGAEPLKSLKEIYIKWVDICEDVYAKYAVSEEYTTMYGEVVNALMNYKKQANKLVDSMVAEMNLPNRQEIDSLHERMHALRRDNIELKRAIEELRGTRKAKAAPTPAAKENTKHAASDAAGKKGDK